MKKYPRLIELNDSGSITYMVNFGGDMNSAIDAIEHYKMKQLENGSDIACAEKRAVMEIFAGAEDGCVKMKNLEQIKRSLTRGVASPFRMYTRRGEAASKVESTVNKLVRGGELKIIHHFDPPLYTKA